MEKILKNNCVFVWRMRINTIFEISLYTFANYNFTLR